MIWKTSTAATLLQAVNAALYNSIIKTQHGPVQGFPAFNSPPANMSLTNWGNISVWKGIPFAATTAGENRFKAPQPVSAWNSTLQAKNWGNICPSALSFGGDEYTIDEDCLNLNIWSAANSTDAKLPVVMWSYPAVSTAANALFDGAGMADKGVVFVNYNYRTGSFGWLASPELNEERLGTVGSNSSGNWGMLDQFAALQWVYENIANFGGDPDHITVMGQSAGSAATYHILNSPLHGITIKNAIIESGVRDPHDPLCTSLAENYRTLKVNMETGLGYMASLNCSDIACMRALPMDDLVTSFMDTDFEFTATLDYYAMPDTYLNTLQKGIAQDVPIMTGNTRDESGTTYGLNITLSTYLTNLNQTYGSTWKDRFFAAYPANDSATASASYNAQFTDRSKVGTYFWSQLWSANATSPVYNYIWDHAPPGQTQGAYHESEINYVLNNLYGTDSPWTSQDYEIAETMNRYWINFIKTGDPNGDGLISWEPAKKDSATVMEVGDGFGPIPIANKDQIKLFTEWFDTLVTY
ncbi:Putative carboxylesterase, type B, carboxylesterase type B, active, alpha/Beta hydrolase [Colletotrichum destructivum]|uniref:Carboxylic ester hydrolase n=1 Tax=Colletotrichum destructivum TaxID=34406 RepID=A0AAX4IN26_9PEZI|nr:Putative carboxylesterase, type B, carboxylesterase type B, active, alpha/Beta hydrolase [Colletotrichum destructivum]